MLHCPAAVRPGGDKPAPTPDFLHSFAGRPYRRPPSPPPCPYARLDRTAVPLYSHAVLSLRAAVFYADLHIHSKYSRATSRDADLEHLALWARRKGITV